jgi:CRISPR type I-E-associated protein CasB/Cse2
LLAAESSRQLCELILPVVRLAKSKGVDVYYEELLWALLGWDAADTERRERIRIRWASSYWQPDAVESDQWTEL